MDQILRNKKLFTIYYIVSSALLLYFAYTKSTNSISQTYDFYGTSFMVLVGNVILSYLLFIIKEIILAIFEILKAKNAYTNARNRVQFFKEKEIVCLEGTIEPQDQTKVLYTPITRQKAVAFSYGHPKVSGGMEQILATVNPSGESVLLNGMLSFDFFPDNTYNPKSVNLSHFYQYILQKKSNSVDVKDIDLAYLMHTLPKSNSTSIHNTVPDFTDELFLNNSYQEKYIPLGIYGWVVGKWGKTKELLPLKFSGCIFVVEKNYKKDFYEYMSQQLKKYTINAIKISALVLFILGIFLATIVF